MLPILERGFADRSRAFWQDGFRRIERLLRAGQIEAPFGYVLKGDAADAGVLLTIRSRRRIDGAETRICNLSSWYVEPEQRWYAPLMLRQAIKREGTNAITDLSPSDSVAELNATLDFSPWNEGMILAASLPWAALPKPSRWSIAAYEPRTRGMLDDEQAAMVEAHLELGCLAAILAGPDGASPLIMRVVRRRGLRVADVLFAQSRHSLIKALPALMRFLLARGVCLAAIDGTRDLCPTGAHFRRGQRRFFKGGMPRDRLDYAFSELILLGI